MIADIIAEDRDGNPILMVEIKAAVSSREDFLTFLGCFLDVVPRLEYAMFVDLEQIRLVKAGFENPETPLVTLNSLEILRFYDPDFAGKDSHYVSRMIFRDYVGTLVEAWLHDLAYHWKSDTPPGTKELSGTGLLDRLEGGMTRSDVQLAVYRVR
ncbi:MAG: hypothetical protein ACLP7Q_16435 [Isosphaeraceae bacterium]